VHTRDKSHSAGSRRVAISLISRWGDRRERPLTSPEVGHVGSQTGLAGHLLAKLPT
jgi:hypothetical protein